ncbi:MAG: TldD/PmbA family protein [Synergistaceae bacterium]|nr:TldD/PmbA family protein [Synergistaceae bacterium]
MSSRAMDELREIISGISRRAGYADLYMQSGASHSILFEEGRMDTLSSSRSDGLGVRVIKGENTIYSHMIGTSSASAAKALTDVLLASGEGDSPHIDGDEPLLDLDAAVPALDSAFFHDMDKKLREECRYLRQLTFRYSTSRKSILIVKGDGSVAKDDREYSTFAVHVVLEKDGSLETGYEARSLASGVDALWSGDGPDAEGIARGALERGLIMLDAAPCPAGNMMALMDGSAGGTMIHEACGHGLEADIIQKDFSSFRDKIGEQVASSLVTLIDDATLRGRYGSYGCDDEGTSAQMTVLIENGVLKGYMTDILSAKIGGLPASGNGRRESYQRQPLPRMSNTFIARGESDFGEMLEKVDRGLLVKKMGGGEVNPTSGDFVFYVSEGYIIDKGKIGRAVKGATLTGNGPEALKNIIAVGGNLVLDPGTCGKSGQSVPVTDGQPTLLISNLTVGGSDTGNDG